MSKKSLLMMLLLALLVPWAANAQTRETLTFNFEDQTIPSTWTNDATYPWIVTDASQGSGHNGTYCIKSGNSGVNSSSSTISATFDFNDDGTISFLGGCWGEGTSTVWDKCIFSIDGAQQFAYGARDTWETYTFNVTAGSHTFTWSFTKDSSVAGTGDAFFVDDIVVDLGEVPACPKPTGLNFALTPGDGTVATLSWTSDADAWQICLNGDETNLIPATTNPYTLTGLTPETTYTAKVRTNCGSEQSDWSNEVTFTPTNAYSITVNDGTTTNGYVPIYGTWVDNITKSQFIIPARELADMAWGTINKMTFYAAADKDWGAAQFEVYMTETAETTLSALADYSTMTKVMNSASLGISGNQMVVEFDAPYQYMGGNLMIGFLQTVSGTWSGCSWYGITAEGASMGGYGSSVSQRNFLPKTTFDYEPGEAPACMWPTNLAVSNIGARSVELSWTENGTATNWQICVNGDEANPIAANTNPYTLTGLTPETDYSVKVRAICGANGYSDWSNEISFTTDVTCHAPTTLSVSDIEAFSANVNWTGTETTYQLRYVDNPNYFFQGFVTDPGAMADGSDASWLKEGESTYGPGVQQTSSNWLADDFVVNTATALTEIEVYSYQTGSTTESTYTGLYAVIYNGNPAEEGSSIVWGDMETNIMTSTAFTNCYRGSDNDVTGMTRPIMAITASNLNIDLEPGTYWIAYTLTGTLSSGPWGVPYCEPNIGMTGNGMQHLGSSNTWQALENNGKTYGPAMKLMFGDMETFDWTYVNNIEANTYAMTNLEPETPYLVQVRATCGGDDGNSEWATATFTTLPTCMTPTALTVSDIEARQVVLSWTENGDATAWEVEVAGEYTTTWDATTNPYTLVGLEPSTRYTVKVRAKCSETDFSDWSNEVTFTTDVSCYAPTNLAFADITGFSANVSWDGEADSYEMEYATGEASYLTYDFEDGTLQGWTNLIVNTDGGEWLHSNDNGGGYDYTTLAHGGTGFAMCYSFIDNDGSYDTDAYLVSPTSYSIADNASLNFWYDMANDVYPEDFEVCVATVANPTASDFTAIWASGTAKGNNDIWKTTEKRQRNTRYNNWREVTLDLNAYAGQSIWIAFHDVNYDMYEVWIDDITVNTGNELVWTPVGTVTSPYLLNNLDPETTYMVRVRANCGEEDGYSTWLTGSFTTDVACPAPTALAATPYANSAVVSWEGISESYTVSYRTAAYTQGFSEEFATSSAPTGWTMYTGLLSNVMEDPTALVSATYGWTFGTGNGVFDSHARCNIYSNYQRWLVTPAIEVPAGAEFSFDLALTAYSGTVAAPATTGTDDKFVVLVSTDNMATWTILRQWDNAGSEYVYNNIANTATGENVSFDFSAYAGQTVYVAFYGESTTSNADNNLHIDNVAIGTAMPAGEWQTANADEVPFSLIGLTAETDYEWKVQGDCGEYGLSEESVIASFTTTNDLCPVPTNLTVNAETLTATTADLSWNGSPDVESFTVRYRAPEHIVGGISEAFDANSIPTGWTRYSGLVNDVVAGTATLSTTTSGWLFSNTNVFGEYHAKVNIYGTTCKYWLVTPEVTPSNGTFTFDLALTDYGNADPIEDATAQADDRFVVLVYANEAWTILREWNNSGSDYVYNTIATEGEAVSIDLSAYVGQTVKIAFYGESTASGGDNDLHIDNVVIGNPQTIPATDWMTVENITDMNVTLTGLTPKTPYEAQVKADCSDPEAWSNTETFTTPELTIVTQTIALSAGWNWVSTGLEITMSDLQDAIIAVVPSNDRPVIKSQRNGQARWTGSKWTGLNTLDLSQMYKIKVSQACEITLEGMPIDPADHPATLQPGANWIAFPLLESMSIGNAFSNYTPMNGDIVKGLGVGQKRWNGTTWTAGTLNTLVPGKGYIYNSKKTTNDTLVFPSPAK